MGRMEPRFRITLGHLGSLSPNKTIASEAWRVSKERRTPYR